VLILFCYLPTWRPCLLQTRVSSPSRSFVVCPAEPADDDDSFDTDDSDSPSSAPSSERIHPDTNVDKEAEPKEDPPIGETEAEGYQSQPPLSLIPSVTSSDRYPTPDRRYGLYSPPEIEAAEAEPGPTTDASATTERDAPSTEKTESTSKSAYASASAS
jgi:hypothetical protein